MTVGTPPTTATTATSVSSCRPSAALRVGPRTARNVVAIVVLVLAMVVGALVLAAQPASAAPSDLSGTRVAAINSHTGSSVGAASAVSPGDVGSGTLLFDDGMSGCCVAPQSTIRITDDGLKHAVDRHTALGPLARSKSVFFDGEDLSALIRRADGSVPLRQGNGNLAYVVDAGRDIGVDRLPGLPTSQYTVITRPDGSLVTTFPGLPTRGR